MAYTGPRARGPAISANFGYNIPQVPRPSSSLGFRDIIASGPNLARQSATVAVSRSACFLSRPAQSGTADGRMFPGEPATADHAREGTSVPDVDALAAPPAPTEAGGSRDAGSPFPVAATGDDPGEDSTADGGWPLSSAAGRPGTGEGSCAAGSPALQRWRPSSGQAQGALRRAQLSCEKAVLHYRQLTRPAGAGAPAAGGASDCKRARAVLAAAPLHAALSAAQLDFLAGEARLRRFGAGEVLVREGQAPDALFLVASGVVGEYVGVAAAGYGAPVLADPVRFAHHRVGEHGAGALLCPALRADWAAERPAARATRARRGAQGVLIPPPPPPPPLVLSGHAASLAPY